MVVVLEGETQLDDMRWARELVYQSRVLQPRAVGMHHGVL